MRRIPSALLSQPLTGRRLAALGLAAATVLVAAPALAAVSASPTPVSTTLSSGTADVQVPWAPRSVTSAATPRPRLTPAPPAPQPAPAPKAAPVGLQPRADGLDWAALARCESGGDPTIVSRTGKYHGLYQFDARTWQSVGGKGVASTAPAAEQTARAQMLYARRGAAPWPECGRRL